MRMNFDTRNVKVLEDFYDNLSGMQKRGIVIKALRKAVRPLIDKAKATAPRGKSYVTKKAVMGQFGGFHVGGGLKASFGTVEAKDKLAIYVGAKMPKGAHGHLVEDGTAQRSYMSKYGKRHDTGAVKGTGFFGNAVDATKDQVFESIKDDWYAMIIKEVNKTRAKLR